MEIQDYIQGQAVMYEITETKSFNTLSERFTDLGFGQFDQVTELEKDSMIVDIHIDAWVDWDGEDVQWTPKMKRDFIDWLNDKG